MKILFSPFSPFVRKCLVSAAELGLADRIELLPSSAHPVERDAAIIADNPLGRVPTFYTDDGVVLYDSRVICEYLDWLGGGRLIPAAGDARWQVLTLQALGDGMLEGALLARYETVARPENLRWPQWPAAQLDKTETSLRWLDTQVGAWGTRTDLGVITIACALWYLDLRFPDLGWRGRHAPVAAWYEAAAARPSFARVWALP